MAVDADTQEIVDCFIAESRESLEEAELLLLTMESGEASDEDLAAVFRLFHSVKGSAGFLEFNSVQGVMHVAETLLGGVQAGKYPLDGPTVDAFCKTMDFLGERLEAIAETYGDEGAEDRAEELKELLQGRMGGAASPQSKPAPKADPVSSPAGGSQRSPELERFALGVGQEVENIQQFLLDWESKARPNDLAKVQQAVVRLAGASESRGYAHLQSYFARLSELATCTVDGTIPPTPEVIRALRQSAEVVEEALVSVVDGKPYIDDLAGLLEQLGDIEDGARMDSRVTRLGQLMMDQGLVSHQQLEELLATDQPVGTSAVARGWISEAQLEALLVEQRSVREGRPIAAPEPVVGAPKPKVAPIRSSAASSDEAKKRTRRKSLRVDVSKLDALMDLVGELIIAETAVTHDNTGNPEDLEKAMAQLSRVTRSLQDVAMSLRMVPIDDTFKKMLRLVRDVSGKQGKEVQLKISGEETEVDKTVAEVIADPLVHLMRNAVDHGMETPEERARTGKPPVGSLHLQARHQAGEIWITVSDDGRGMDRNKILAKGIEKGLVTPAKAATMSDTEVFGLVFAPGFSTAAQVTDISGRGVGMDVVKKNIEKVKGRIEVHSELGKGTRFTLRIPLTLAIIEGMLVRVGQGSFTIPLLSIRESVVLRGQEVTRLNSGQEVARIRNELIPVLRLRDFYRLDEGAERVDEGVLVVVEDAGEHLCLFVDELLGQRQTVVKGLSSYLGDIRGLSGCTVMGDGRISLILDVAGVMEAAA
ncbi:MAG: chemotaxis protein CheA [Myxococcota bacterium]|nr:chemotaxis protein CheA [Myxococcota bacterium]